MVSTSAEDLTKALEAVAEETVEDTSKLDSTSSEGKETQDASNEAPEAKSKPKAVSYDRFKQVNDKFRESSKSIEALNSKLTERDDELAKLVDLLADYKKDSLTVQKINELHSTRPDLRELINTLDAAVRGQEVAIEKAEEKKAEAEAKGDLKTAKEMEKVTKQLETTKSELEASLAEQRADLIIDKADRIIGQYFEKLPEAYTEEDKKVLSKLLVDQINWDEIEKDPKALNDVLARDFKSTVEWYGSPRGNKSEATKETKETTRDPSVDDLKKADWGKIRVVEDAKGKRFEPVVSEDDFTKALAAALRKSNDR